MNKYICMMFSLVILLCNTSIYCKAEMLNEDEEIAKSNSKFIICIDPGHQKIGDSRMEPVSPSSNNKKSRVSAGTAGVATKTPEHKVNLDASIILKNLLTEKGYTVVMTREVEEVNISNIERAKIANDVNANITIRIHCDSLSDSSKTGATILVPSSKVNDTMNIYNDSNDFAEILKNELKSNGVKVNGVFERNDITGFNWSKVPVVILEMGFMSNYNEDRMLNDSEYQMKLMTCVMNAIEVYTNQKV